MMRKFKFKYPGDPVFDAWEMNRKEFLAHFPRKPIYITTLSGTTEIPTHPNMVCCDCCGRDPGDLIYVTRPDTSARAYCTRCAGYTVTRYALHGFRPKPIPEATGKPKPDRKPKKPTPKPSSPNRADTRA